MLQNGYTYMHEHVYIDLSSLKTDDSKLDCMQETIDEFKKLKTLGVNNILEVTNIGMGRNISFMEEVKKQSGMNLLYCTGFYQEMFFPLFLKNMTQEEIYQLFIKELTVGMDDTNDLSRIVIGHTDLTGNEDYIQYMLDQGINIAFDTIGKLDYMADTWRVDTLYSLINKGYGNQIVLSLDITRKSHLEANGGLGYSYLIQTFLPMLLERGISQKSIDTMLINNPQKILNK